MEWTQPGGGRGPTKEVTGKLRTKGHTEFPRWLRLDSDPASLSLGFHISTGGPGGLPHRVSVGLQRGHTAKARPDPCEVFDRHER